MNPKSTPIVCEEIFVLGVLFLICIRRHVMVPKDLHAEAVRKGVSVLSFFVLVKLELIRSKIVMKRLLLLLLKIM